MAQITPTPTRASNESLLTNISRLASLNPRERLALKVYLMAKELANDGTSPLTTYDPDTDSKVSALVQDSKTVFGSIPTGDIATALLAIDWANCKAVYGALSTDVDTLLTKAGVARLREYSEDELVRMAAYLRLEIGE